MQQYFRCLLVILAFATGISAQSLSFSLSFPLTAFVGSPFTFRLSAQGGTPPYRYEAQSGLPAGATLTTDGVLLGTVNQPDTYLVTIRVSDSTSNAVISSFALAVASAKVQITSPSTLPPATVGVDYEYRFQATGGNPPYFWGRGTGAPLPHGLSLSIDGVISGRPTLPERLEFDILVQDTARRADVRPTSLTVLAVNLKFTTSSLPDGVIGVPYSAKFQTSGGIGAVRFERASGTPPPGIQLLANGDITGTPTTAGTYSFTMRVTDANNNTTTAPFQITVPGATLRLTSGSLPAAAAGVNYSANLSADGGRAPYRFEVIGTPLPSGLTLSPTGTLSGIPAAAGTYSLQVRITDAANVSITVPLQLVVWLDQRTLTLDDWTLSGLVSGFPIQLPLPLTGGRGPYTTKLAAGALPPGLRFAAAASSPAPALVGTPWFAGSTVIDLQVTDANGISARRTYTLTVEEAPLLSTATVGSSFVNRELANQGTAFELDVALNSRMPLGLRLDPDGTISGNPWAAGDYRLAFRVQIGSQRVTKYYRQRVLPAKDALALDTVGLPPAVLGRPYRQRLLVRGETGRWSVLDGDLPPGITLSETDGLRGVPSQAGSFLVYLNVLGASGKRSSIALPLVVEDGTAPVLEGLTNAASYAPAVLAPGELMTMFGAGLGPAALESGGLAADGKAPVTVGGLRVLVGGVPARLLYASETQASFFTPFSVRGKTEVDVWAERAGMASAPWKVRVDSAMPGIFTQDGSGQGLGSILNQDGSLNGTGNRAPAGNVVVLFVTGLGQTQPEAADGEIAAGAAPALEPVIATVGPETAEVLYAGAAPGLLTGVGQVNLRVPAKLTTGVYDVVLTQSNRQSVAAKLAVVGQ